MTESMDSNDPGTPEATAAKVEALEAVFDRLNAYEETAEPEQISTQLDEALAEAGVDLDASGRRAMVDLIAGNGSRDDVRGIVGGAS